MVFKYCDPGFYDIHKVSRSGEETAAFCQHLISNSVDVAFDKIVFPPE